MEIKFAFLRKEHSKNNFYTKNEVHETLSELFSIVNEKSLTYSYNDEEIHVEYSVSKENRSTIFLILSVNLSDYKAARVLDSIKILIARSLLRENFFLVNMKDDSSQHFCGKAYKRISEFERLLREVVSGILSLNLGADWYDSTIPDDLHKEICRVLKTSSRSALIQQALSNMTLFQLDTFLFVPYRKANCNELVDDLLNSNENFTKQEIMIKLSSGKAESLWERYFKDIVLIPDLSENLDNVREYRNIVAHSKELNYEEYLNCMNTLKLLNIGINEAIVKLEDTIYQRIDSFESLGLLSATLGNIFKDIVVSIAPIQKAMSKIVIPKFQFDFSNTEYKRSLEMLSNSVKQVSDSINLEKIKIIESEDVELNKVEMKKKKDRQ